ncbi:MAG: hypothetical protein PHQ04_05140 [Opitutaceae bacterium]|nr:hypothetical protein [Opitutaceae bacterium]
MPTAKLTLPLNGPAALRALARALAHLHDFDRFVAALQGALDQTALFERTTIRIDRALLGGEEGPFAQGRLTLPLAGGGGRHGTLQAEPGGERRQFGAEDLHLLAGLADFVSAALDQSQRLQEAERLRELLRLLLNQAPVGLAAYAADRRLLAANDLAARWLGGDGPPLAELAGRPGGFHVRTGGKLIYGEARQAPGGVWVVALHDLTPEQARLMEALQRETYRALAEGKHLGFALIESAQTAEGVLRRLPALRAELPAGAVAGPYDANRLGLVLAGEGGAALRMRLRKWQFVFREAGAVRLGCAELARDGRTPEALLEAALQHLGPYEEIVRPAVLVHDGNAAVTEAIALVLGRDFRVVRSTEASLTRELLRRESFDLLVAELDPRSGPGGVELARFAREMQPGIKPLFTTVRHPPCEMPAELAAEDAVVIGKPFAAGVLARTARERLENHAMN